MVPSSNGHIPRNYPTQDRCCARSGHLTARAGTPMHPSCVLPPSMVTNWRMYVRLVSTTCCLLAQLDWRRTVQTIVKYLQDNDFYVVYYNSRGVGKSTGWPSFTGKTEGSDLEVLVQHFLEGHPQVNSVTFIVRRPRQCLHATRVELKQ